MAGVLTLGSRAIISLVGFIITVPVSALMLWVTGKIFKEDIDFLKSFFAAAIIGVVGLVLGLIGPLTGSLTVTGIMMILGFIVSLALYLILPKLFFDLEWGRGILVGLVWFAFMFVIGMVIGAIVTAIIIAVGFAGLA